MWNSLIELLVKAMSQLSGIPGFNTGLIILVTSLVFRFAFLPLTIKVACNGLQRQKKLQMIQPQLDRIKHLYRNNPEQLNRQTLDLYKKNEIAFFDKKGLISGILQAPLFIGMISAINRIVGSGGTFLWISDIARPDILLTAIAAALSLLASTISPNFNEQGKAIIIWMPVILTAIFLWKLSAGIGLYWVASNLVNVLQSLIVRHKSGLDYNGKKAGLANLLSV